MAKPILCIDCRFYQAGDDEAHDMCTHDKAQHGQVRTIHLHSCEAMRAGICRDARLFEARQAEAA